MLLARARVEARAPDVIRRLEWIVQFVEHGQSLENTAKHVGVSTATLRRWIKRFNPSDLSSLEERSHMPQKFRTSNVPAETVAFIREYRERQPLLGKERIAELLLAEHNVTLSASTVGRVIDRENLYFAHTPLHLRKRIAPGTSSFAPTAFVSEPTPLFLPKAPVAQPELHEPQACRCLPCRFWNFHWNPLRRGLLMGSVLANIAVIALLAATMLLESESVLPTEDTASVLHTSAPVIEQTNMPFIDSSSRQ